MAAARGCRAGAAPLVLAPQLALYKWITGEWFVNAYVTHDMGFTFGSPHLLAVLFSTQKGLFFWSPVLLLSVAGVFVATGRARALALPAVVLFALQTWLIASWVAVAVRRELRASRLHRRLRARRAVHRVGLCVGGAPPAERVPFVAVGATAAVLLSVAQMIPVLDRRAADGRHDVGAVPGSVPAVPMTRASWLKAAAGLLAVAGALGYLYDPPWMGGVTSGLRPWEQDPPGTLFRWTAGRATFFVPSNVATMTVPLRAVFPGPNGAPVTRRDCATTTGCWRPIELSDPDAWVRHDGAAETLRRDAGGSGASTCASHASFRPFALGVMTGEVDR